MIHHVIIGYVYITRETKISNFYSQILIQPVSSINLMVSSYTQALLLAI